MASIFSGSPGGRVAVSCAHRDVDYRGDCSQVKGGAGAACSHEPGEPHLHPMGDLMGSYNSAGSFFIVSGVSRQYPSPLPRGIS